MKIGLFSDRYLPNTDGITYSIESFRIELERMGHDVYVIAPAAGLRTRETNPKVIRLPAVKGLFFEDFSTSFFFPPQVMRKLDKIGLEIIHYHTPSTVGLLGAYYALRHNIPLLATYHTDLYEYVRHYPAVLPGVIALSMLGPLITGGGMEEYRNGLSAIRPERSIDRWNQKMVERGITMVHNHCDLVIAPSDKMANQLKLWKTTAPLAILPTGVDPITTQTSEISVARQQYGLSPSDQVILFVGRIGGEKNVDLLVRAFALIADTYPHAKLLFIGEGPDREELIGLTAELGLAGRVSLPGQVVRSTLGAIYALSDIFAFLSTADTQGLVVNEAALAGLPLVMIDPHVSEIMRDNVTGLYAKPTAKDVAAKLTKLLENPSLRKKLGDGGKNLASKYGAARQAKKLVAYYEQAMDFHARNHTGTESNDSLEDKE